MIIQKIKNLIRTSPIKNKNTPLSDVVLNLQNRKLINPVEKPRYDNIYYAAIKIMNEELGTEYESCFCDTNNWVPCSKKDAEIYKSTGDYEVRKSVKNDT